MRKITRSRKEQEALYDKRARLFNQWAKEEEARLVRQLIDDTKTIRDDVARLLDFESSITDTDSRSSTPPSRKRSRSS